MVGSTLAAHAETPIISAPDAAGMVASGELVLLDIRRPAEWQESGIAEGAWPVSMHTPAFASQLQAILEQYDPSQIALICATGGRTAYVTEILERNGINGVADVSEGMFGNGRAVGWLERGLPVITPEQSQALYIVAQEEWN